MARAKPHPLGTMIFLCAVLAPPAVPADVPGGEIAAPALPPLTLSLEEIWRVGGESDELLFGTVTETTCDRDGNVYLLDSQLCHVVVISPRGEHLRTLSREGEGPGEVRQPRDVILLPDGTVGIMIMFPARIVRLSREGEPREALTVTPREGDRGGFIAGTLCDCRGGNLVLAASRLRQTEHGQDREMYLCSLSATGQELVRYCEARMSLDFRQLHFVERELSPGFQTALALGPDGKIYVAQAWDHYAVAVYQRTGALERIVARPFTNRKRTAQELRRINALFDASARNSPYGETREIEPCPPAITSLYVDADDRLWVQHSRSGEDLPPGIMQAYDLFDPHGRYLQRVLVACEGDPEYDGLQFLPDGRVLLIKGLVLAGMAQSDLGSIPLGEGEDSGNMEFVCYRSVE